METALKAACRNAFKEDCEFGVLEDLPDFISRLAKHGVLKTDAWERKNVSSNSDRFETDISKLTAEQREQLERFSIWDQKFYDICRLYLEVSKSSEPVKDSDATEPTVSV